MITAGHLAEAGIDPRLAARLVQRKEWQRPARGVYVTHPDPLGPRELARAALAYAGPTSMVTGALALELRERRWVPATTRAHVLVPTTSRIMSSGRVQVTRWSYDEPPETDVGLALAPESRAVVDAARACAWLNDVRGVVLAAVADGHVTVSALQRVLEASQRNGSAQVRRAVRDAERGCASPPEAELVDALVGRGVPFLVNPQLWRRGGLLGSPDLLIVGRALVGEVESDERHGSAADRTATYDRHERFAAAGLDPVHLSVERIRRDVEKAALHLLARARRAVALPADITVVPRGPVLS